MKIYIDENLAPVLSKGFDLLQRPLNYKIRNGDPIEVRSIKEDFGIGAKDEHWIPKLEKGKDCVITQDYNINRIREQRQLCEEYDIGIFYFRPPSKKGFGYWEMLMLMVKHWLEIIKYASNHSRPFAFKASSRSSKLEDI